MRRTLPLLAAAAMLCAACGGSPISPSNAPTYAPAQDPAGATSLTYSKDIQPILAADCTACHSASRRDGGYDFTSYAGVLRAVTAGSAQSPLVRATQSNGTMYRNFRGSAAQKAETIRRWVVDFGAAQ
jgi:hypothetical protein